MLSSLVIAVKISVLLAIIGYGFAALLKPAEAKWIKGRALFVMIFVFVCGMLLWNVWPFYFVMICLLPIIAKDRVDAAALYVLMLLSMPYMPVYLAAGSIVLLPVDKYICCSIGLGICYLMKRRTGRPMRHVFDLPFLLLFALELIQFRGENVTSMLRDTIYMTLCHAVPYFVISRSLTQPDDLRKMTLTYTFGGVVLGVVGAIETKVHWLIYQTMYTTLHAPLSGITLYAKLRSGALRAPTSFDESTSFALFLAFTMILSFAGRDVFRSRGRWLIALCPIGLGMVAANSRNAWLALAIGIPAFDLYRRRYASLAAKIGAGGILLAVLLLLAQFSPYIASMVGKSQDSSSTTDYRTQLLHRGIEEIRKHPWIGVDIPTMTRSLKDMTQGEGLVDIVNGYLQFALTAGIGGAIALLVLFLATDGALLARRKRLMRHPAMQRYAAGVFAIAGFSIATSFYTGFGGRGSTHFVIVLAMAAMLFAWRGNRATLDASAEDASGRHDALLPAAAAS